jgi:hypothetical protein
MVTDKCPGRLCQEIFAQFCSVRRLFRIIAVSFPVLISSKGTKDIFRMNNESDKKEELCGAGAGMNAGPCGDGGG